MDTAQRKMTFSQVELSPSDVAKYFLHRAYFDGDVITPLKMQKMLYLAYKQALKSKVKLFQDEFEAWKMGPVIKSLYDELEKYGSSPIPEDYVDFKDEHELEKRIPGRARKLLDKAYEEYIVKSAFELVSLVHQDKAWLKAREGLGSTDSSDNVLDDKDILFA